MVNEGSPRPGLDERAGEKGRAAATRSDSGAAGFALGLAGVLGVLSFGVMLAAHNIADGDLWAKLALGAHVWHFGALPHQELFAFTPGLPEYVDHEWGAGAIFFGLLRFLGPSALMWLKILLFFGALACAVATGRRGGCAWPALLLLAIPAAFCVLLGYIPVIRSHTFTYFFFAVTLLGLEMIFHPGRTPASASHEAPGGGPAFPSTALRFVPPCLLVVTMLVWVNVHGGFVAGLGIIAIYTVLALYEEVFASPGRGPKSMAGGATICAPRTISGSVLGGRYPKSKLLLAVFVGSLAVTCINPYGIRFWAYLLPAVLAKRPLITEWQPLPIWGNDAFLPFRVLFLMVVVMLVIGWKGTRPRSWTGLLMMAVTAFLAWRSRRHAPFFGVAAAAFAGPYLASTFERLCGGEGSGRLGFDPAGPGMRPRAGTVAARALGTFNPLTGLVVVYALIALYAAIHWLPLASFEVLAPVGHDPVREADILSLGGAKGNLATPFHWGSYCAWRLHPDIKISMDGRYEAAYPESTFQLNTRFFDKAGPDWARLVREYHVDYVLLDLSAGGLKPDNLRPYGYTLVWESEGSSALLALDPHAARLREVARRLPPATINPLDATIPDRWWPVP